MGIKVAYIRNPKDRRDDADAEVSVLVMSSRDMLMMSSRLIGGLFERTFKNVIFKFTLAFVSILSIMTWFSL